MEAQSLSTLVLPADASPAVTGPDEAPSLEADLARLRAYLERGAVEAARQWAGELERLWPSSDIVREYVQVLAPPRVSTRSGDCGPSRKQEREWLREHARDYPGLWLAVLPDRLLAAEPRLENVLEAVRKTPGAQSALIHYQPGPDE